jgi:hypothetical protein
MDSSTTKISINKQSPQKNQEQLTSANNIANSSIAKEINQSPGKEDRTSKLNLLNSSKVEENNHCLNKGKNSEENKQGQNNNIGQQTSSRMVLNSAMTEDNPSHANCNYQQQGIGVQPMIIQNQILPYNHMIVTPLKFLPGYIQCPFCKHYGMTSTKTSFSVANLMCCVCCGPLCWALFQLARSKDFNCTDADHFCGSCGKKVYSYESC